MNESQKVQRDEIVPYLPDEKDKDRKSDSAPQPLTEKPAGFGQHGAAGDARQEERHGVLGHHAQAGDSSQGYPPAALSGLQQVDNDVGRQHPPQVVEGDVLKEASQTGGDPAYCCRPGSHELGPAPAADFASHQTRQHHGDAHSQSGEEA